MTTLPFQALGIDKIIEIAVAGDEVRAETERYYRERGSRLESVYDAFVYAPASRNTLFQLVESLNPEQKTELSLLLLIGRGLVRKNQWSSKRSFAESLSETSFLVEKIEGDDYLRKGLEKLGIGIP